MELFQHSVFIGRLQPIHKGHIEVINKGLEISNQVIIVLGSIDASPNIKNPFTFEERKAMIRLCFSAEDNARIQIIGVRDYHYKEHSWITEIQSQLANFIGENDSKCIIGNYKDASSYYLKYFLTPEWDFVSVENETKLDATYVRGLMFDILADKNESTWLSSLSQVTHPAVAKLLTERYRENVATFNADSETGYKDRVQEYRFINDYKARHKFKDEKIPYSPTFMTVDALVTCSGHLLVIKRKFNPGKGTYALPGGFVKDTETLKTAVIRELKEETGIKVDRIILESSIVKERLFDYPNRSLRGRTITNCYHLKLKDGKLPEIKASDDAEGCFWMPFYKFYQNMDKFFEDHSSMIESMLELE